MTASYEAKCGPEMKEEGEKRNENFRRSWENYSILNLMKSTV